MTKTLNQVDAFLIDGNGNMSNDHMLVLFKAKQQTLNLVILTAIDRFCLDEENL